MKISWLNGLYEKNITFQGQHKIVGGYFYGVTDGGLLLKIATQTFRDGAFDFVYGAAPLIVPIRPDEKKYEIYISNSNYAGMEYCRRKNYSVHAAPGDSYVRQQCRGNALSVVEQCCAEILHMVDSDFSKCNTVRGFSDLCEERYSRLNEESRRALAAEFPRDCPLESEFFGAFGCYIYVNVLFGNYDKALARVRGERHRMRQLYRASLQRGDWSQEQFDAATAKNLAEHRDITIAMLNDDTAACEAVLERNYQENRRILAERLGFSLPESYKDFTKESII